MISSENLGEQAIARYFHTVDSRPGASAQRLEVFVPGAGVVRVQGMLPIGVKVDSNAAETADVAADAAAFRGDSSPIKKGQTGKSRPGGRGGDGRPGAAWRWNGRSEAAQAANGNMISVVATDSNQPPKKTEQVRKVQLPPQNPVRVTYDANGQPSVARRPTRTNGGRSERSDPILAPHRDSHLSLRRLERRLREPV